MSSYQSLFGKTTLLKTKEDILLVHKWVSETLKATAKYQLLWQGTTDGYAASTFHTKCNGKGPTLTVIQSDKGNVFGGYTSEQWGFCGSGGAYKYDPTAFVYSLTHKAKCDKQKDKEHSIDDNSGCGPLFGYNPSSGSDIDIDNNCNTETNYCNLGSYELPPGGDENFLAGSHTYTVKEIEVYAVQKQ